MKSARKGIAVSGGVAFGNAYLLDRSKVCVIKRTLHSDEIDDEIMRLREAIQKSKEELQSIKSRASSIADKYSIILDTYTLLLEDEILVNETIDTIKQQKVNAEWALTHTLEKFTRLFNKINDDYLKGKKDDLELVVHGVIKNLIGHHQESLQDIDEPVVIITHELSPSDTLLMSKNYILGLATEVGGRTSHLGIFASALGIPALVGVTDLTQHVNSGDMIIIDAIEGEIIIKPNEEQVLHYRKKQQNYLLYEKALLKDVNLSSETLDGRAIHIMANIESVQEAKTARKYGGEGVGLYRTELLYMGRESLPNENDLYLNFKKVAREMDPYPVVIRTLDIGADKQLNKINDASEDNPALGLRGIRLSLVNPDMLISQMKAILRASFYGKIKILYPMISTLEELTEANKLLKKAKKELKRAQIPFDNDIEVGAMIETPAAALALEHLLGEVDFISIGTNDLIQYVLAVDRTNENVAYLYQPFHPAILKLLKDIFVLANARGKPVSICGEMGGDPMATLLLLGLGEIQELSMEPHSIPKVKKILRKVTIAEAKILADKALTMATAKEINQFISEEMRNRFPTDFDRNMVFEEKSS
ncbi:MAG: phosphoenolpyruvate--protein phosphotransferase [Nitrospina sp.]|nr:MAG: phosphoenolpyruvate--protein phosphotransferase [Nitrospina sp.]